MRNTFRRIVKQVWKILSFQFLKRKIENVINQSWLDIQTPAFKDRTYRDILTWWERRVTEIWQWQDSTGITEREQDRVKRIYGVDGV